MRLITILMVLLVGVNAQAQLWVEFHGERGPGKGKKIVLISGDEEYRSEESLPQLARILAKRHGFDCTVLFAIDPADGMVDPNFNSNIPGLSKLRDADLVIMLIRWRNLPDDQMKEIVEYAESGRPMIGLRTATHPFNLKGGSYRKYSWDSKEPYEGGFGKQIFGETWISHHGDHGKQGTRGIVAPPPAGQEPSAILRGVESVFGPTDVYGIRLPLSGEPILFGQVTETLQPDSKPVDGPKNNPMMPIAWTRSYRGSSGKTSRVFMTTMGASQDFVSEGFRRMMVNAVYWSLGMEKRIPAKSNVDFVGEFKPSAFGFRKDGEWKPGKPPSAY